MEQFRFPVGQQRRCKSRQTRLLCTLLVGSQTQYKIPTQNKIPFTDKWTKIQNHTQNSNNQSRQAYERANIGDHAEIIRRFVQCASTTRINAGNIAREYAADGTRRIERGIRHCGTNICASEGCQHKASSSEQPKSAAPVVHDCGCLHVSKQKDEIGRTVPSKCNIASNHGRTTSCKTTQGEHQD